MIKPKQSVVQMQPYPCLEDNRMRYTRLDFNENTRGASPSVLEALQKITCEELGCYPEYKEFTLGLSQFLGVADNCVLPTNGSDEAIRALFDTYIEKGDEVLLLSPSYSLYEHFAQIAGAKINWVLFGRDFVFPIQEVLQAITPNTRLIGLANPNNPTGTLIQRKDLEQIIQANPNMLVLLDEAYTQFTQTTNMDLFRKYPNVFVTQTFSKAYGLAALRIGYLISSPANIEMVSKVISPSYSVDRLAMLAATATMKDQAYFEHAIKETIEIRDEFATDMQALGLEVLPSSANFVLVNFGRQADLVRRSLEQSDILVRDRSEESLKGYLRITIGTRKEMRTLIGLLQSYASKPALIFDMDGVLVDESQSYRPCILKTAESFLGKNVEATLVEQLKMKGGYNNDYDCTQAVLSYLGLEVERCAIVERFDTYYDDLKNAERWILDDSILIQLQQKFRLGIFTGRPKRDALDALKRFNKESFFEIVITDDDVKQRKPDPEGLFLACQALGKKEAIYVGDSVDDAEAARRAGFEFINVLSLPSAIDKLLGQGESRDA